MTKEEYKEKTKRELTISQDKDIPLCLDGCYGINYDSKEELYEVYTAERGHKYIVKKFKTESEAIDCVFAANPKPLYDEEAHKKSFFHVLLLLVFLTILTGALWIFSR